jgi:antitoxin (DNA-binding transcriptional repressor) of toxin-antitoxin stability system
MSSYSVAEAKAKLSALINEAMEGKSVVITRHGQPVVELRATAAVPRRITQADLDWLAERRKGLTPAKIDATTLLSKMRDEDWK